MLKLKFQYFSYLMGRANTLEKTLILGKIEGRSRGWQRTRCLDSINNLMDMSLSKLCKTVKDREVQHAQFMESQRVGQDLVTKQLLLQIWEWDHKEGWAPKNWCFWIVVLEKTLESPFDSKEIKPVNLKGNQPWIFIERTDAEAETPILWPPDAKNQLIGKDSDAGKDWRQEEKGRTEDVMVGRHHQLDGHEFKQTPGDSAGQGSLACFCPLVHKELGTTKWLNNEQHSC